MKLRSASKTNLKHETEEGRKQQRETASETFIQIKENETIQSPIFNFHIHIPPVSGNVPLLQVPSIQPVIHLHFDDMLKKINLKETSSSQSAMNNSNNVTNLLGASSSKAVRVTANLDVDSSYFHTPKMNPENLNLSKNSSRHKSLSGQSESEGESDQDDSNSISNLKLNSKRTRKKGQSSKAKGMNKLKGSVKAKNYVRKNDKDFKSITPSLESKINSSVKCHLQRHTSSCAESERELDSEEDSVEENDNLVSNSLVRENTFKLKKAVVVLEDIRAKKSTKSSPTDDCQNVNTKECPSSGNKKIILCDNGEDRSKQEGYFLRIRETSIKKSATCDLMSPQKNYDMHEINETPKRNTRQNTNLITQNNIFKDNMNGSLRKVITAENTIRTPKKNNLTREASRTPEMCLNTEDSNKIPQNYREVCNLNSTTKQNIITENIIRTPLNSVTDNMSRQNSGTENKNKTPQKCNDIEDTNSNTNTRSNKNSLTDCVNRTLEMNSDTDDTNSNSEMNSDTEDTNKNSKKKVDTGDTNSNSEKEDDTEDTNRNSEKEDDTEYTNKNSEKHCDMEDTNWNSEKTDGTENTSMNFEKKDDTEDTNRNFKKKVDIENTNMNSEKNRDTEDTNRNSKKKVDTGDTHRNSEKNSDTEDTNQNSEKKDDTEDTNRNSKKKVDTGDTNRNFKKKVDIENTNMNSEKNRDTEDTNRNSKKKVDTGDTHKNSEKNSDTEDTNQNSEKKDDTEDTNRNSEMNSDTEDTNSNSEMNSDTEDPNRNFGMKAVTKDTNKNSEKKGDTEGTHKNSEKNSDTENTNRDSEKKSNAKDTNMNSVKKGNMDKMSPKVTRRQIRIYSDSDTSESSSSEESDTEVSKENVKKDEKIIQRLEKSAEISDRVSNSNGDDSDSEGEESAKEETVNSPRKFNSPEKTSKSSLTSTRGFGNDKSGKSPLKCLMNDRGEESSESEDSDASEERKAPKEPEKPRKTNGGAYNLACQFFIEEVTSKNDLALVTEGCNFSEILLKIQNKTLRDKIKDVAGRERTTTESVQCKGKPEKVQEDEEERGKSLTTCSGRDETEGEKEVMCGNLDFNNDDEETTRSSFTDEDDKSTVEYKSPASPSAEITNDGCDKPVEPDSTDSYIKALFTSPKSFSPRSESDESKKKEKRGLSSEETEVRDEIVVSSKLRALDKGSQNSPKSKKMKLLDANKIQVECINKEMQRRSLAIKSGEKGKRKPKTSPMKGKGRKKNLPPPKTSSPAKRRKLTNAKPQGGAKKPKIKFPVEGNYIPLQASGSSSTRFAVAPLDELQPYRNHEAVKFKHKMLFGERVRRFSNAKELDVYKLKQKARRGLS